MTEKEQLLASMAALDDSAIVRENIIQAPFPYAGSKAKILEKTLQHLPQSEVFVDVCGGSGAVILGKRKCKLDVYNDVYAGPTNFYRCLRDKVLKDQLIEKLQLTIHGREEFVWCKQTWENINDPVEKAYRWYYMSCYSFGGRGLYFGRVVKPVGMISPRIRDALPYFDLIHERFQNVQVEQLDWRTCFKDFDSHNTVFYVDPPYYGNNIYKHNFTKQDHIELCTKIFALEGYVVLAGYDNPIYDNYPWDAKHSWDTHVRITTRAIETDTSNCKQLGTDEAVENIWIKDFY